MTDSTSFRTAMRHLTAAVCLITTTDINGRRYGMTATAVCSVSAEPPTLLVCINRNNSTLHQIRAARAFVVNVLGTTDRDLAERFSQPMEAAEKFARGEWRARHTGAPVLRSALVSFECHLARSQTAGSHDVVFGAIQAIHLGRDAPEPLLYGQGAYRVLAAGPAQENGLHPFFSLASWSDPTWPEHH